VASITAARSSFRGGPALPVLLRQPPEVLAQRVHFTREQGVHRQSLAPVHRLPEIRAVPVYRA